MGLLLESKKLSLGEEGSAFLASAVIAKSYRVETTSDIVTLWKELQGVIPFEDDLDFASAILVTGRIMDLKEELRDSETIAEMVKLMRSTIGDHARSEMSGHNAIISAFITSAYITETEQIETTHQTVQLWREVSEALSIDTDEDIIPALLTVGRISELKRPVTDVDEIKEIFETLKEGVSSTIKKRGLRVRNREIVTAFMASAIVSVSPKVERIRDVINTWIQVREALDVHEDEDIIAVILSTGRIRDLDALHMIKPESLSDLVKKIKKRIATGS